MKKTVVFFVSIALVFTLSTPALAAESTVAKTQPDTATQFQVAVKDTSTQTVATKTFDTSATHVSGQTVYTHPGFKGLGPVNSSAAPSDTILYSLGVAMPQTVFGGDDRVQSNTLEYPFSAVCYVEPIWDINDKGVPNDATIDYHGAGTGFMVSPDECVTAAHVIYDDKLGWATWVNVYPAKNGTYTPYGPTGTKLEVVPSEYINGGNPNVDWGVLKLTSSIGSFSGYLTTQYQTNSWAGTNVAVAGYPDDKQTDTSGINRTQWHNSQFLPVDWDTDGCLQYKCDTDTGESGGPIYKTDNVVIGVNAYWGSQENAGCRMSDYLYNMIISMQK